MRVRATGDVRIDDPHANEDVALAIGTVTLSSLKLVFEIMYLENAESLL